MKKSPVLITLTALSISLFLLTGCGKPAGESIANGALVDVTKCAYTNTANPDDNTLAYIKDNTIYMTPAVEEKDQLRIIIDGKTLTMWSGASKEGFKADDASKVEFTLEDTKLNTAEDAIKFFKEKTSCSPEKVDPAMFVVPADIKLSINPLN